MILDRMHVMKANQAKQELETMILGANLVLDQLSIEQGATLMIDFYHHKRFSECAIDDDGDMLLFQWGTYDWGEGRFFEFDLTRQFMMGDGDDEDIWQLSLNFKFSPNETLTNIVSGNKWCDDPSRRTLEPFDKYIRDSAAYKIASTFQPERIELSYFNAG